MSNGSPVTVHVHEAIPNKGTLRRTLERVLDKWFNQVDWLVRLRNQELLQAMQFLLTEQGAHMGAELDAVNATLDELDRQDDSIIAALRGLEDKVNAGEAVSNADLAKIRERLEGHVVKLDAAVTDANTPDAPVVTDPPVETPVDPPVEEPVPVDPPIDVPPVEEPPVEQPPVEEPPAEVPVEVEPELPVDEPAPAEPTTPEDVNNAPGAPDMGEGTLPADQVPVDQTPPDEAPVNPSA